MNQPIVVWNHWITPETTWGIGQIGGTFCVLELDRTDGEWMINCPRDSLESAIEFIEHWIDDNYPNHVLH